MSAIAAWFRPILALARNRITLAGAVLTTSSALTTIGFWASQAFSPRPTHPYLGILGFLILPGFFAAGLVLIPLGVILHRRRLIRTGAAAPEPISFDFRDPAVRKGSLLVAAATVLNIGIFGVASYLGITFMETENFCGETCHTVMQPEYSAYKDSPHSRVACVECHIGPGANWFVKSKLSGTRQLFAVALETYSKPIPSPVTHLRPARETCEHCHWPQKFHGDKFRVKTKYSDDEKNTPLTTVLVLKIGGHGWKGTTGIHGRHLDETSRITYVATDERRQEIPVVRWVDEKGQTVEFVSKSSKASPEQIAAGEVRSMDCLDCHNRPTHAFPLPERAVDEAMAEGTISPDLPWIKKKAVEVLRAGYPDQETAKGKIAGALEEFYRSNHPDVWTGQRETVDRAIAKIQTIYTRHVFPEMKLDWGYHPNNIGHEDFPGCFRCHDDEHESKDGRTISQSCESCHTLLAMEESDPKILADLGLK